MNFGMIVVISLLEKMKKLVFNRFYKGDIINNSIKDFDFTENNIYKISRIVSNKEKHITPNYYSKTCKTTGLLIFILKDALEYIGILSDKKTHPSLLYRLYKLFYKNSKEKCEKLSLIEKKFQFN